jgi:hypothetical protein
MEIKIVTDHFETVVYGLHGIAINKDYAGTAFQLSGKTWEIVKTNKLGNKGKNIWVYENGDRVFAGVELDNYTGGNAHGLDEKKIYLEKYAYYNHIGPYALIGQAGQNMRNELKKQGYEVTLPYLEIYGHWTKDENKLETELIMCLK